MTNKRERIYFPKAIFIGVALCCLCGGFAYWGLFISSTKDREEYRQLLLASNPAQLGNVEPAPYTARQKRYGVKKDVSYVSHGVPLQVCLTSQEAELVLDRQGDEIQIIEEMAGVQIYMQEELFFVLENGTEVVAVQDGKWRFRHASQGENIVLQTPDVDRARPMQIVRYLEAETGTYFYQTDKCIADQVLVERYLLPGHTLEYDFTKGKQILKGVAQAIELVMGEESPRLVAHHLNASALIEERL